MIKVIKREQIEEALSKEYRQYLTGHLRRPQPFLEHVEDDIEIGMSYYREFAADTPHVHPVCTEHAYVLQGSVKVRLLDGSNEEYELRAGDLFVFYPGTPYATKNAEGTKVLFIKSPGMNDKTLVEIDDETKRWLSDWES